MDDLNNRRRFAEPGVDDIGTLRPELIPFWDPSNVHPMSSVYPGSGRPYSWRCPEGHQWQKAPVLITRMVKDFCPFCADREVWPGLNDLATMFPEIASEIISHDPTAVRGRTSKTARWRCPQGHEYSKRIYDRTLAGRGCPFCRRTELLVGFNDLATTHPEMAKQWAPRNPLPASSVMSGSNHPVWWRCPLGHEWELSPNIRTQTKSGASPCPVCANRQLLTGFNDLATRFPMIAKDYAATNARSAAGILFGSNDVVDWECTKGHRWSTTVVARTLLGHGCRRCGSTNSKEETKLFQLLAEAIPDLQGNVTLDVPWGRVKEARVDMFSTGLNLVIEYDGAWWHRNKLELDTEKTTALLAAGHHVLRVREGNLPPLRVPGCAEVFGDRSQMDRIAEEVIRYLCEFSH